MRRKKTRPKKKKNKSFLDKLNRYGTLITLIVTIIAAILPFWLQSASKPAEQAQLPQQIDTQKSEQERLALQKAELQRQQSNIQQARAKIATDTAAALEKTERENVAQLQKARQLAETQQQIDKQKSDQKSEQEQLALLKAGLLQKEKDLAATQQQLDKQKSDQKSEQELLTKLKADLQKEKNDNAAERAKIAAAQEKAERVNLAQSLKAQQLATTQKQIDEQKSELAILQTNAKKSANSNNSQDSIIVETNIPPSPVGIPEKYKNDWSLAHQGNATAQVNIGFMYENGLGVNKDIEQGVAWYRKAAEQGNSYGQNNLGVMYELGIGENKNIEQAVEWYRMAAKQGHTKAQENLKRLGYNP